MLKAPWLAIAQDLLALARQAGWTRTCDFTAALLADSQDSAVAVVRMLDADADALEGWLKVTGQPATTVKRASSATAAEVELAERLLVLFPCGGLPSSKDVADLRAGPLGRPAGATAIVLTNAERIQSAEDLRVVEATARRWLLPATEDGVAPPGDLSSSAAFLWSVEPIADAALAARVARDMSTLRAWISSPWASSALPESLDRHRVLAAVQMAHQELEERESEGSTAVELQTKTATVYRAHAELAELRDRVLARLRSDGQAVEAGIRAASDGLEVDLLAGLTPFVDAHLSDFADSHRAGQLLDEYCRDVLARWRGQPRSAAEHWQRSLADVEWQVKSFPAWTLINEGLQTKAYPERLVAVLARAALEFPPVGVQQSEPAVETNAGGGRGVGTALVAGLLGAGAGVLTGLGAPAVIAGLGVGALAGSWYGRNLDRTDRRRLVEDAARQELARLARHARATFTELVDRRSHELRHDLSGQFGEAAAALDQILRTSAATQPSSAEYRERLRALSTRVPA